MDNIYDISKWLINNSEGMSSPSKDGNLKLQKLLYYANAIHLVAYDSPLFHNVIEAWAEGPVVKDAYVAYRYNKLWNKTDYEISKRTEGVLETILDMFGDFSARELVNMTHDEMPWKQHEENIKFEEDSYNYIVIPPEDIKEFYTPIFGNLHNEQHEKKIMIDNNVFVYNKLETELTTEDIDTLKSDFSNVTDEELFVYKDNGELVAY